MKLKKIIWLLSMGIFSSTAIFIFLNLKSSLFPSQSHPVNIVELRAAQIRKQIEIHKEWGGGHSPIPTRAINANTFTSVRRDLVSNDIPALQLLLFDDASDIRNLATSLLECIDPNALEKIEEMIAKETIRSRQYMLMDARTTIMVIRAGNTSCK